MNKYTTIHQFMANIPSIKILNDGIEKTIYQETGLEVQVEIVEESFLKDPYNKYMRIQIKKDNILFISKIDVMEIPDNFQLSFFINKIKEEHPQMFV
jgi:hypothetical protein